MIRLKRVYDPPSGNDGKRILVDRLWPRGLKKETARIDDWLKELGPSTPLRKWFGHDPAKWTEFRKRFQTELRQKPDEIEKIVVMSRKGTVTLLYGSKEERYNNAVALKEYLEERTGRKPEKKAA